MKKWELFTFVFVVMLSSIPIIITYAAVTIDNANRREYTYCPISDANAKLLDAEVNGCPVVRVFINNWSNLSIAEQTAIDTRMRSMGFVDAGEHIIR